MKESYVRKQKSGQLFGVLNNYPYICSGMGSTDKPLQPEGQAIPKQ